MPITIDFWYDNSEPLVDYSASYSVPANREPAATLENLYPTRFPVADCIMSLDCACARANYFYYYWDHMV